MFPTTEIDTLTKRATDVVDAAGECRLPAIPLPRYNGGNGNLLMAEKRMKRGAWQCPAGGATFGTAAMFAVGVLSEIGLLDVFRLPDEDLGR